MRTLEEIVLDILIEMKRTNKWNTEKTKLMFKFNNELNLQYETNHGCSTCVQRVFNRLVQWFKDYRNIVI